MTEQAPAGSPEDVAARTSEIVSDAHLSEARQPAAPNVGIGFIGLLIWPYRKALIPVFALLLIALILRSLLR